MQQADRSFLNTDIKSGKHRKVGSGKYHAVDIKDFHVRRMNFRIYASKLKRALFNIRFRDAT